MILNLVRRWKSTKSTIGELFVDGKFECFTLEDITRTGAKVYGETAIPKGTYRVVIDLSERFGRRLPHILDVPEFEGVRIHAGNTAANTLGCVLVGETRSEDFVGQSKTAFEKLFRKLDTADSITLTIQEA